MTTTSMSYRHVKPATVSYDIDATDATVGCDDDATTWRDGLPIGEAARALDMTKTALRKRVERKTIPAHKGPDGQWYVVVPREATPGYDRRTPVSQEGATPSRAPSVERTAEGPEPSIAVEVLRAEVGVLTDELVFLRDRLVARDREIQELHVLLQTAQRLLPVMLDRKEEATANTRDSQRGEVQTLHEDELPNSTDETARGGTLPLARTGWQRFVDWLWGK